ncbi:hypothetical protein RHMOL_Rhmol11G0111000 [Rhododendron molle]|uniref:Uncharacterized protein n=1 Tax=Rhododendron molle TaxID=49168 RepID=A0ACC0LS05_RHOML|nr:hypothetical protein RHMOL_Rhmol11G0111000 [Rhododendron molle]
MDLSWKLNEIFATGVVIGTYLALVLFCFTGLQKALLSLSQSWSFMERPGSLLMCAYVLAQLVATLIAVYAEISFASISVIGWGWSGDIVSQFLHQTAFTSKHDYGKDDREAKGAMRIAYFERTCRVSGEA